MAHDAALAGPAAPNGLDGPLRWLLEGVKGSLLGPFFTCIALYLALCCVNGFAWTTEISPTYGLLIIRVAFAAVLAVVSVFTLPFQMGPELAFFGANLILLAAPLTGVDRLLYSGSVRWRFGAWPGDEIDRTTEPHGIRMVAIVGSWALMATVLIGLADEVGHEPFQTVVWQYLADSPSLQIAFGVAVGVRLLASLILPRKFTGPPLTADALQAKMAELQAMMDQSPAETDSSPGA